MSKYASMDGRQITKAVQVEIQKYGVEMSLLAEWDHLPADHRARLRAEKTAAVRAARDEGRAALAAWADATVSGARARLREDPLGSPAEESRRVSDELRLARVLEAARAEDARTGAVIPDGMSRPVRNASAYVLADRARRAYLDDSDYPEAVLLARASAELGGPPEAARWRDGAQALIDAADPAKARAMHELLDVEVVLAAAARDVNAAVAGALTSSAALARSAGEVVPGLGEEAAAASMTAKMAAAAGAIAFGDGRYVSPLGVLAEGATNLQDAPPPGWKMPEPKP